MATEFQRIDINETKIPTLQQCASCKCKMLLSFFDIIENTGVLKKTCRKCLERNKIAKDLVKYGKSVIYKICCKDENITECYVGSTTNAKNRKKTHKSKCTNKNSIDYNRPVYRYIRDNGGFDNWIFEVLENYPCRNKEQLVFRERFWFEKLGATLNSCYPQRSMEQYRKDNKVEISEKGKKYYEKNKVEISEKRKERYEKNKVEISEKGKEKVECECGSVVRKDSLTKHKKTQKHQNYLKLLS
jgi:hypothetical protein